MRPYVLVYLIEKFKVQFGLAYLVAMAAALINLPLALDYAYMLAGNQNAASTEGKVLAAATIVPSHAQAVHSHTDSHDHDMERGAQNAAVIPAAAPGEIPAFRPDSQPIWPMPGRVTTEFGVPHWPWQPTHTGIDISSGQRSGITAVKPIKEGTVIKVVFSYNGLGNYVVVDHGDGMTSYYAHLHSITVKEGQNVRQTDILGYEGNTGASTGTHLHLEIRMHDIPGDPRLYLSGNPD